MKAEFICCGTDQVANIETCLFCRSINKAMISSACITSVHILNMFLQCIEIVIIFIYVASTIVFTSVKMVAIITDH